MHCHRNSYALSREESADERLAVIRARIRASLDDPRPNLSLEEVDAHITTLVAKAERTERDAAAKG
jgi:antitoxin ParD1/3/4